MLGFKVDNSGRKQYDEGIDQTKQKQQSLTASFLKANLIMAAASRVMGAAFSFVRDSVIGATAETERFRVVIGSLIGDQEKANQVIHDLDYSPVSDFYGTAAAIGGLRSFVTMGMDIEKAKDQMTLLGDVAQGNSEAFSSLSANMAQVYSKGKADAMDLKQFMAQGFDVAGVLGLSEAQKKAGVTYAQVEEALKKVTAAGGPYNDMLKKQMNTLGGVIKQFQSFKAATAEAIGNEMNEDLKELLKYILEIGKAGQDSFVNVFVKAIKEVIHWIFQIIIMWKVLGYEIADMGGALTPVKQFFSDLRDVAGSVLTGIMILVVEVGKLFVAAFKPIQDFASPIIRELGAIAKDVLTAIAGFIRPIIPMVKGSAGFFGFLGQAIAGLLRPAMKVALAVRGITLALGAYKAAMGVAKTASFIFSGDLAKMAAGLTKLTGSRKFAGGIADTFGLLTGKLSVMKKAAEGNRVAMMMLNAQMLKNKVATLAHAAATKIAAAATAAWDWIKMAAGVMKSTAVLIANKIATVAVTVAQKIAAAASKIWAAIQWVLNAAMAANPIGLIIIAVLALIAIVVVLIKNWDKVKAALIKGAAAVGNFFAMVWEGIKKVVFAVFDVIKKIIMTYINIYKAIFTALIRFFVWLWEGIVTVAKSVWEGIKNIVSGVVDGIKNVWSGIIGFFSGLWEAIKEGPSAAIEYIKNAFFGLFDGIKDKFFGFINIIKEGWETVKGFFGGIADGVVNLVTGGSAGGGGQMQPAYAGGTSQAAMASKVGQTSNYAYTTMGASSTVNAQTSINVNVPSGTPQEQREAIARQVDAQFNAKLADSINSSRANIPSPEVRRH